VSARRDRWLSLAEVIALLAERFPDLLKLRHASRRKKVRRIIERAERRDGERYSKFHGRELVVSRNALESLLPYDGRVVANLENSVAQNAQNHRELRRQVNGLASRVRTVEQKQELTRSFLASWEELNRTGTGQERDTSGHLSDQSAPVVKIGAEPPGRGRRKNTDGRAEGATPNAATVPR